MRKRKQSEKAMRDNKRQSTEHSMMLERGVNSFSQSQARMTTHGSAQNTPADAQLMTSVMSMSAGEAGPTDVTASTDRLPGVAPCASPAEPSTGVVPFGERPHDDRPEHEVIADIHKEARESNAKLESIRRLEEEKQRGDMARRLDERRTQKSRGKGKSVAGRRSIFGVGGQPLSSFHGESPTANPSPHAGSRAIARSNSGLASLIGSIGGRRRTGRAPSSAAPLAMHGGAAPALSKRDVVLLRIELDYPWRTT
eukprot:gene55731-10151_t